MKKLVLVLAIVGLCLGGPSVFAQGLDANTVLLLHCNGADGSTTFVDDSYSNHPVTANGDVQLDTAQKVFGTASMLLDGDSDYCTVPDSDDWNFGAGDFTIDFWVRFNSMAATQGFYSHYEALTDTIEFYWKQGESMLNFRVTENNANTLAIKSAVVNFAVDTWYHITVARSGDNWYMFKDGVSLALTLISGSYSITLPDLAGGITFISVGAEEGGISNYLNGWLDEFRISKGIARWTSDFSPPTHEYGVYTDPPVADAGPDLDAFAGELVTLDGSYSHDPDGSIVSWDWRSLSDPQNPIVANGEVTTMNAHGFVEELIELTVTDNYGVTGTDTMKIINPGVEGPPGPPGIPPEEIAVIEDQITTLQQQNQALQQQNSQQQEVIEGNRYLLEQLPQLRKKLEEIELQVE
jgi:hypothetical protein